jgi:signal transduction histidine kinase/DNA-binding response OmpR family regulator
MGYPQKKLELLETLHLAYAGAKQVDKAYAHLQEYQALSDSLSEVRQSEKMAELDARFQSQQQQYRIERLHASNSRIRIILLASALMIILLAFFAFFARKSAIQRRKTNIVLAQQTARLKALDETKSRFFTNLSHELRTPLALILGPLAEALKNKKVLDDQALTKHINIAHRNTKKLLGLVNEIMELSSLEAGKATLSLSNVKLQDMLRRCFFAFESGATLSGVRLLVDDRIGEPLWIQSDVNKLEKILTNLVSNALKHSPAGSMITLVIDRKDDVLMVEVSDAGTGIHPDDLPHIFDRYFQTNQPEKSLQGGTGLGLALARELIHLMSGSISVTSELGMGSTFSIKLPYVEGKAVAAEGIGWSTTSSPTDIPVTQTGQVKESSVLIVEDNPDMAAFLQSLLADKYHIQLAGDGMEALKYLEKGKVDLLLSDIMMPRMDGFELIKRLKADRLHASIPTILLTARNLPEDKIRGLRIGVDDYITKPFHAESLLVRIDNLLLNKRVRQDVKKEAASPPLPDQHAAMLAKAEAFIEKQIGNSKLKVSELAIELAVSERQVFRVIRQLTGLTPIHFIREIRLRKARQLLEHKAYSTVGDVAYDCGFENPSYFTKIYQERYGIKPSEV